MDMQIVVSCLALTIHNVDMLKLLIQHDADVCSRHPLDGQDIDKLYCSHQNAIIQPECQTMLTAESQ